MEKFSAIGKSKIKNINVKSEGDMKKKMSITMTKLMFAIPMAFCIEINCAIYSRTSRGRPGNVTKSS